MERCHLLALCQELRDIIYEYAFQEDHQPDHNDASKQPVELITAQALGCEDDQYRWIYEYPATFPTPTWLALRSCNRQLRSEVQDFLSRREWGTTTPPTVKMAVNLDFPFCKPSVSPLPNLPHEIRTLEITINLLSIYDSRILPPSHAVPHAVWRLLQRYLDYGPNLGGKTPLRQPLRVERLRVRLAEPRDEDLAFTYGNPWMQMHSYYSCLKWALGLFARAAESAGEKGWSEWSLRAIETKFRGRWEHVYVSKEVKAALGRATEKEADVLVAGGRRAAASGSAVEVA